MSDLPKYIVLLRGGIGNQLFQYAYAKYLQSGEDKKVAVYYHFPRDVYHRENIINKIDPTICLADSIIGKIIGRVIERPNNILTKFIVKMSYLLGLKLPIKRLTGSGYDSYTKDINNSERAILRGYWQSAEMVNLVKDELLQKLSCDKMRPDYLSIMKQIDNHPNPVAMHIRSNWHMGYAGDKKESAALHNQQTLTKSYYLKAVQEIKKIEGNPFLFIFADDFDKVASFVSDIFAQKDYLIVPNYNNVYDDYASLILMSHCKHFIISNSTFGWWGAWLNHAKYNNKNSLYIIPNHWDKDDQNGDAAMSFKFSPQCILLQ